MTSHKTGILPKHRKLPLEDADPEHDQLSEVEDFAKAKVECICPGCGKMHIMKMRWIGRGVPRKFCEGCRNRETPLDGEDF
jgi:transposase-like protein